MYTYSAFTPSGTMKDRKEPVYWNTFTSGSSVRKVDGVLVGTEVGLKVNVGEAVGKCEEEASAK
jgi:hypothetical protein